MIGTSSIWENVARGGDKPFLISPHRSHSYAEFKSLVARAAASFRSSRVTEGDRIIISLEDEAMASAAFVASVFAGIVPIILPRDTGTDRRQAIHRLVEPALVVADEAVFATAESDLPPYPERDPDKLAYLIFTSGTTGEQSGVEITRRNLFSHLATLVRLFGFNAGTRVFNPTPLAHTDGLIFGPMLAVSTGGSFIRPGPLNLSELNDWIGLLTTHDATHMVTNPTVLQLIDRSSTDTGSFRSPGFRGIISSASLLRPEFWRHFEERFGTVIWNLYGLTETVTSALYAGRHPDMGMVGSLGKPIDCEARIAPLQGYPDLTDQAGAGELELKGEHIFRGYWKNAGRTASTFTPDGWMKTGDLVRGREDGSFEFLGRVKAAINSGGTLIRGEEIDECLLRHDAVAESVTVGLKDDVFEEIAVSAVVLSGNATEAALTEHCRAGLERLKVPKRIIAVPSIPRGDSGKPNLNALRKMLSGILESGEKPHVQDMPFPQQQVLELAALVFRCDPASLSLASSPQTVEGWDSFTHINLILQVEEEFSIRVPSKHIPAIKTLSDLCETITMQKSGAKA